VAEIGQEGDLLGKEKEAVESSVNFNRLENDLEHDSHG